MNKSKLSPVIPSRKSVLFRPESGPVVIKTITISFLSYGYNYKQISLLHTQKLYDKHTYMNCHILLQTVTVLCLHEPKMFILIFSHIA